MKTRLVPLLLTLVLFAAACGDDGDTDTAESSGDDRVTADVDPGSSGTDDGGDGGGDDGDDDGAGWIDGEPTDGGSDLDSASTADGDRAEGFAGDDMADTAAPEFIEPLPPVDQPLQAGSIDDAEDVARYTDYRDSIQQSGIELRSLDVRDSTVFTVVGSNGLPVLGATVEIHDAADQSGEPAQTLRTRADGTVRFLPHALDDLSDVVRVTVLVDGQATEVGEIAVGTPDVTVEVDAPGGYDGSVPLDVHFVLDSTGSMGDEISQLRTNMTSVAQQIDALPSAPDVRFGMTVYRDEGDAYVTRTFDLTDSLDDFLEALDQVQAEGGGDYPEAMDEALADALEKPDWRRDGAVQLMFLIADAPPQVGRNVQVPHTDTAVAAAEAGVKIFPIAASGTDDQAEFVMRELAFVTGARFVFLSYGEFDSATGSGTDITTGDFDELPLDQLVVRLVQDELAALTGIDPVQTTTTTAAPPPTTVPTPDQ